MHKLQLQKNVKATDIDLIKCWLTDVQDEARQRFMSTMNPQELALGLSSIVDHLLDQLYRAEANTDTSPMAMVAVGGYGRRELCPYSDIDLLFLYPQKDDKESAAIAEAILYTLWDLGFKVGHAQRSIDETLRLAAQDTHIKTSLLDARLICGNPACFDTMMNKFWEQVEDESPLYFVEAKLRERDNRHQRFGASRYRLEPNVKEGKGGLRDLHTLWWLMRYVYRVDSLNELVERGYLHEDELDAFFKANRILLAVRILLHYESETADERLTFDNQKTIARAMGFHNSSDNLAITRFMRRYFMAVRTVGSLTRIICALLEDEKKHKPQKPLGGASLGNADSKLFKLDGTRINTATPHIFEQDPTTILLLFHTAQEQQLDIHPQALRAITQSLHLINDDLRSNEAANRIFLRILQSEHNPEITLRRMSEAGVLGRFIPEFGRIIGQTQYNMYHIFTVDEHTLVALGTLHAISAGKLKTEAPLATEIMPGITQKHVLYLALFCHDIAKGRDGDHSELGERIALRLATRFGYTTEEQEAIGWLVRNHLYLSSTAFKRDLNDPKTIADFVAFVGTAERLKLLLVLTVADIRAVAPGVWNEWKALLMRDLYIRAMQALGNNLPEEEHNIKEQVMQLLRRQYPHLNDDVLNTYEALGSEEFWSGFTLKQHLTIGQMLLEDTHTEDALLIRTSHDTAHAITELIISAKNKTGLFAKLSGSIALAGATIISAKVFTLNDGRIVDIFQIQDIAGNAFDRPSKLAKMAVYAEQSLEGGLNLKAALKHRDKPYEAALPSVSNTPASVFFSNDVSNVCSVIEISCRDRIGLLHDIAEILADVGLSIVTAHITTYGVKVADVFYVKDTFGMKIHNDKKIEQIRDTIFQIL